jgi:hypothetical protein
MDRKVSYCNSKLKIRLNKNSVQHALHHFHILVEEIEAGYTFNEPDALETLATLKLSLDILDQYFIERPPS